MYRIDNATAAAAIPAPEAVGPKPNGFFTNGDAVGGTPATIVDADWANAIQEEIAHVIEQAGDTLDKADRTQLYQAILAIISGLSFSTPPQFDNDSSVATTAFVQRALGNRAGARLITATATLTAADAGKSISVQGASAIVLSLPLLADVSVGSAIEIVSQSQNQVTVQRQGADVIAVNNGNSSLTSIAIGDGESLFIVKQSTTHWIVFSGAAALKYTAGFANSLAANGYQKLPGDMIIQWGTYTAATASEGAYPVTFPLAFPTACDFATVGSRNPTSATAGGSHAELVSSSLTGLSAFIQHDGSGITSVGFTWFAIGR